MTIQSVRQNAPRNVDIEHAEPVQGSFLDKTDPSEAPAERFAPSAAQRAGGGSATRGAMGWLGLFSPVIAGGVVGLIAAGPVGLGAGITAGLLVSAAMLILGLAVFGEHGVNRCLGGA